MMSHPRYILPLLCLLLLASIGAGAQELNCKVTVDAARIGTANASTFTTLQTALTDYINTRKWTSAQVSPGERIDCNMFLTIKSYDDTRAVADLQISSSRPVYNSSYVTTVLNFKDTKVDFDYREGDPLIANENSIESNLIAVIDFYCYLILALDFDTFSPHGGDPWYARATQIVQMAQSSTGESGWKAFEDTKNRSAVLTAFTDPSGEGLRDMLYTYHRRGLDEMALSPDKARARITDSLEALEALHSARPMSVALSMIHDAKMDELVNLYTKAPDAERKKAAKLLETIYPSDNSRIDMIRRGTNKQ